eukprot:SAG22_NODE_38_length_26325_cov_107.302067_5_plen_115_part_00
MITAFKREDLDHLLDPGALQQAKHSQMTGKGTVLDSIRTARKGAVIYFHRKTVEAQQKDSAVRLSNAHLQLLEDGVQIRSLVGPERQLDLWAGMFAGPEVLLLLWDRPQGKARV